MGAARRPPGSSPGALPGLRRRGIPQGRRRDLQGGDLLRSAGGRSGVRELRHGREAYWADERILSGSAFIEQVRAEAEAAGATAAHYPPLPWKR